MRIRLIGWLASFAMHLIVGFLLIFVVEAFRPVVFSYDQVYEVDLVSVREPAANAKPLSPLKKAKPEPRPEPPAKPEPQVAKAPEPKSEPPSPQEPPAQTDAPETQPVEPQAVEATSGPAIAPVPKGTARIASRYGVVKVPREEWNKRLAKWVAEPSAQENATARDSGIITAEESKAFAERLQKMRVIQKRIRGEDGEEENVTRVVGTRGFATFADTFMLDQIAYGEYTTEDFAGHYTVHGGGYLSIVDARETNDGKLILHEHKSGLTRTLVKDRGKVYCYGPEFGLQEPHAGSVTFMPKQEDMEHIKDYRMGHLFWLPEDPPMRWCKKILFEPKEVSVPVGGTSLDAFVLPPAGEPAKAAVIWHPGERCLSQNATLAVVQTLTLSGVAVMGYAPRGCSWPEGEGAPANGEYARAGDLLAAARALAREPGYGDLPIGLWGEAQGADDVLLAAKLDPRLPFAVVSLAKKEGDPPPKPPLEDIAKVRVPLLFMLTGGDAGEWLPFTAMLEESGLNPHVTAALPESENQAVRQALDRYYLSQTKRFAMHLDEFLSGDSH
jgi:hypothetical protein